MIPTNIEIVPMIQPLLDSSAEPSQNMAAKPASMITPPASRLLNTRSMLYFLSYALLFRDFMDMDSF
ncbi:MAG: hypothetical protein CMJ32_06075 [Phycisphaerae bacterium]|nr:hypothetical protein [Phycisphaerae bacterium]